MQKSQRIRRFISMKGEKKETRTDLSARNFDKALQIPAEREKVDGSNNEYIIKRIGGRAELYRNKCR